MKNKKKLALAAIGLVVLIAVAIVASRWIGQLLIGSVDQLQTAGSAPLPTDDIWVAPTLAPEADYVAQEAEALENQPDAEPSPTEEPEGSAPVLESPEDLAGTADQSSIVDENPADENPSEALSPEESPSADSAVDG